MSSKAKRRNYRKREATPEESADSPSQQTVADEGAESGSGDQTSNKNEIEGLSLDELIELRKLRQRPSGIATADLLVGDTTGKKKKKDRSLGSDDAKRQEEGEGAKSSGILNTFTKQTNALDVDKHMMKYIEEEMKKRRGDAGELEDDQEQVAQEWRGDTEILNDLGIKRTDPKPEQEGNVQLSTTMLTAIPEVDLGMDSRLRNIEETEKAKRKLFEERTTTKINTERFSAPSYIPSDRERITHHQQNRRGNHNNNTNNNNGGTGNILDVGAGQNHRFFNTGGQNRGGAGRGMATDDLVMERFKKRMRR
ncbi:hypothetical protein BGW38_005206 [Lunasporangiospora selenospora]|uniref:Hepatocellular carcinoma-associated antigen 59 n=1 Tax=Lunasporangiospora selenospora TaxID=979761 RepID=A0A9P6G3R0_9FUNG|nr:hypothetical protein BGW38_005206 [Lunasporangiospora selenospora]